MKLMEKRQHSGTGQGRRRLFNTWGIKGTSWTHLGIKGRQDTWHGRKGKLPETRGKGSVTFKIKQELDKTRQNRTESWQIYFKVSLQLNIFSMSINFRFHLLEDKRLWLGISALDLQSTTYMMKLAQTRWRNVHIVFYYLKELRYWWSSCSLRDFISVHACLFSAVDMVGLKCK